MKLAQDIKRRLRVARRKLSAARCTCPSDHDAYWVECERTMAQIEFDGALAAAGFAL